jgi:nucleoid-associated protein EbfC
MPNQNQINRMLRQVQQMQADMEAAHAELEETTVEGSAGGGAVKATMTGSGKLQAVTISPTVVDPDDVEMLQDLVVAAVTEAAREAKALSDAKLGAVQGPDISALGPLGGLLGQ